MTETCKRKPLEVLKVQKPLTLLSMNHIYTLGSGWWGTSCACLVMCVFEDWRWERHGVQNIFSHSYSLPKSHKYEPEICFPPIFYPRDQNNEVCIYLFTYKRDLFLPLPSPQPSVYSHLLLQRS